MAERFPRRAGEAVLVSAASSAPGSAFVDPRAGIAVALDLEAHDRRAKPLVNPADAEGTSIAIRSRREVERRRARLAGAWDSCKLMPEANGHYPLR